MYMYDTIRFFFQEHKIGMTAYLCNGKTFPATKSYPQYDLNLQPMDCEPNTLFTELQN